MSSESEDNELRDLLFEVLEEKGSLSQIKAQIRACTFLALDEDEKIQAQSPLVNNKIKTQLESKDGLLMFHLVHEFLQYFNMKFTIPVFTAESYLSPDYLYKSRDKLLEELNMPTNDSVPILLRLIQSFKTKSNVISNGHSDGKVYKNASLSADEVKQLSINIEPVEEDINSPKSVHSDLKDDTYEDTSLIAEDSIKESLEKDEKSLKQSANSSMNSIADVVNVVP